MTREQLERAKAQKATLRHKKGTTPYIILGFGEYKTPEREWIPAISYMDVKTKKMYVRALNDCGNFSCPKLKD